jgi:hypothetical protein
MSHPSDSLFPNHGAVASSSSSSSSSCFGKDLQQKNYQNTCIQFFDRSQIRPIGFWCESGVEGEKPKLELQVEHCETVSDLSIHNTQV